MKDLLATADEIPVTLLVALAYLALAALTDPFQPTTAALVHHGAARGIDVADGEAWRLLTYAFLHGGVLHLALNTYALILFGPTLERSLGSVRFALLYAVTAVAGGVAGTLWINPLTPLVGGSGALFGMLGAAVALMARGGREPTEFVRSSGGRQLLGMIALNLVLGFLVPQISNSGHIGGLLAGFALTYFAMVPARLPRPGIGAARATVAALAAGALAAALLPAHRWDFYLVRWQRETEPQRRAELREAFNLLSPGVNAHSDAELAVLATMIDAERRADEDR